MCLAPICQYQAQEKACDSAATDRTAGCARGQQGFRMRNVYGENVSAKEVLRDNKVTAPAAVRAFSDALDRYSPGKAG